MTYDIEHRRRVEVTPLGPGRALVVGSYDDVRAHLARLSRAGRLLEAVAPAPVEGRAGLYQATVRQLREVRHVLAPAPVARWYHDWRAVAAVVAGCVAVLSGVVWLAYVVLSWIFAVLVAAGPLLLGLVVLFVLASAGGSGGGTFSGTFSGRWR